MSRTAKLPSPLQGSLIRFEIRDGSRRLGCAITNDALEAIAGLPAPSSPQSHQRSFDRFRALIQAAAMLKLRTLPSGTVDAIILNRQDLQNVPREPGAPILGKMRDPIRR